MTDTMTSQNIVLSSWDTLYIYEIILHISAGMGHRQVFLTPWLDSSPSGLGPPIYGGFTITHTQ
jgi:hypothetical protein